MFFAHTIQSSMLCKNLDFFLIGPKFASYCMSLCHCFIHSVYSMITRNVIQRTLRLYAEWYSAWRENTRHEVLHKHGVWVWGMKLSVFREHAEYQAYSLYTRNDIKHNRKVCGTTLSRNGEYALLKNIGKFGRNRVQSHIWLTASLYVYD